MYPRDFFDTYWRPEIRDEVFVAMPFHAEFTPVWEEAIRPAIDVDIPGPLRARRVDASVLSGSVITDILDGIAHSRLILADISIARDGKWCDQRNGNVMYEVGLAHAIRQTTEVLLVRSDQEDINFDVAHIKIHSYNNKDLPETRSRITRLVADLLAQIDQEKSLKVTRAIDLLDSVMMNCLGWVAKGPFTYHRPSTMGEVLVFIPEQSALSRLQRIGILRFAPIPPDSTPAFFLTSFGIAVAKKLGLNVRSAPSPPQTT